MIGRDRAPHATTTTLWIANVLTEQTETTTIEAETRTALPTVANDTAKMTTAAEDPTALAPIVIPTAVTDQIANTAAGTATGTMVAQAIRGTTATESTAAIDHPNGARLRRSAASEKRPNDPKS